MAMVGGRVGSVARVRDIDAIFALAGVTPAAYATYASMRTVAPTERLFQEGEAADGGLHAPPGFLPWVAQLVHAHRQRLLAYARKRGLDAEDSLDAVQESFVSFLRLPEARSMAREGDDAIKLLTVLLRHQVQNVRRKAIRRRRVHTAVEVDSLDSGSEDSATIIARAEELARVQGCILRMARLQRQVVLLSILDEQPREQVAETLGISQVYLRVLLHRAREHVRTCSFTYGDDLPEVE
jgi:RNA polymerase sigma factor (sigma-70 family)